MKGDEKIITTNKDFTSIAEIVINSLRVFSEFKAEYNSFRKVKKLDFGRIDRLEKELFDLKDATHALFRAETAVKKEIKETDLYDLIVSSIFHEMLHLKEYIYILDKYEPSFDLIEKRLEDKELEDFKKDFLRHSREMVGEAKLGLPLKIQGINEVVVRSSGIILLTVTCSGRFLFQKSWWKVFTVRTDSKSCMILYTKAAGWKGIFLSRKASQRAVFIMSPRISFGK